MSAGDLSAQARVSCDSSSRNCVSVISRPSWQSKLVIATNGGKPPSAEQHASDAVIVAMVLKMSDGRPAIYKSRRWAKSPFGDAETTAEASGWSVEQPRCRSGLRYLADLHHQSGT